MVTILAGFVLYFGAALVAAGVLKLRYPLPTLQSLRKTVPRPQLVNASMVRVIGVAEVVSGVGIALTFPSVPSLYALALIPAVFLAYMLLARKKGAGCGCGGAGRDQVEMEDLTRAVVVLTGAAVAVGVTAIDDSLHSASFSDMWTWLSAIGWTLLVASAMWASRAVLTKYQQVQRSRAARQVSSSSASPATDLISSQLAIERKTTAVERELENRLMLDRVRTATESVMASWSPVRLQWAATAASPMRRRSFIGTALAFTFGALMLQPMRQAHAKSAGLLGPASMEVYPPAETVAKWTEYVGPQLTSFMDTFEADSRVDAFLADMSMELDWSRATGGRADIYDPRWSASLPNPAVECLIVPSGTRGEKLIFYSTNTNVEKIYVVDSREERLVVGGDSYTRTAQACDVAEVEDCAVAALGTAGSTKGLVSACVACATGVGIPLCLLCAAEATVFGGAIYSLIKECGECASDDPNADDLARQSACMASRTAFSYTMPCCINRGGPCLPRGGCPAYLCNCADGCPTSVSGNACQVYFAPNGEFCACGCCCFTKPGVIGP